MSLQISTLKTNKSSTFLSYLAAPFLPSSWKVKVSTEKLTKKEVIGRVLTIVALYYAMFCPLVAMPIYNSCIFHPYVLGNFYDTTAGGVKAENRFFKSADGTRLHGWYFPRQNAKKVVLLSHGNTGNITHRIGLVNKILATGASVFAYDYRGFGLSSGTPGVNESCADGVAAFDYLNKTMKIPAESIVLYGESLGTGISAQIACKRKCAGVILQSPFRSIPLLAREKMPLFSVYPDALYPINKLDTLSFVKENHSPLLILHGQKDAIVAEKNAEELYSSASGKKQLVVIANAGHNDILENLTDEAVMALNKFCN